MDHSDRIGRRPILISGAFIMATCHIIVAILTAQYRHSWPSHTAAGWAACVLIWIFAIGFGYSWGPGPWVLVAEIFPRECPMGMIELGRWVNLTLVIAVSVRGKGLSIAASSNWVRSVFLVPLRYGLLTLFKRS